MQLVGRYANLVLFLCLVTASSYAEPERNEEIKKPGTAVNEALDRLDGKKVNDNHDGLHELETILRREEAPYSERAKQLSAAIQKVLERANADDGRLKAFENGAVSYLEVLNRELKSGGPSHDSEGGSLSERSRHEILNKAAVLVQFLTNLYDHAEKLTPEEIDKLRTYSGELRRRENLESPRSIYSQNPKAVEQAELPKRSSADDLREHYNNLERHVGNILWERAQKQHDELIRQISDAGSILRDTDPLLRKLTDSELVAALKNLDPWILAFDRSSIGPRGDFQMPIKDVLQVQSKKKLFSEYLSADSFAPNSQRGPLSGGF